MKILNNDATQFYDDRYSRGYMEKWPQDKKKRVREVIESLHLPEFGQALDFGCGNGVFTEIIKQALPQWEVYGSDISEIAVQNASKKNLACTFFVANSPAYKDKKFDFIFSHHVLEHVVNIEETVEQINYKAKDNAFMLHILPCGNENSFEWKICQLVSGGIDKKRSDAFFFEYEGHLRRMTSNMCILAFRKFGFTLGQAYYANQYYSAINWITRSNPKVILKMFNPLRGKNIKAKLILCVLLGKFIFIATVRLPYVIYQKFDNPLLKFLLFIPSYTMSVWIDAYIIKKSDQEWETYKTNPNGSEMYLSFVK